MPSSNYWHTDLAEVVTTRRDQASFHVFAEGMHSDLRGQVFNLSAGDEQPVWTAEWPRHVFIVLVVAGAIEAVVDGEGLLDLRPLSQLVVLPGTPCRLRSTSDSVVQIISLVSQPPTTGAG